MREPLSFIWKPQHRLSSLQLHEQGVSTCQADIEYDLSSRLWKVQEGESEEGHTSLLLRSHDSSLVFLGACELGTRLLESGISIMSDPC